MSTTAASFPPASTASPTLAPPPPPRRRSPDGFDLGYESGYRAGYEAGAAKPLSQSGPGVHLDIALRFSITSSGLTPYALAKLAGVSPGMIARFVAGNRDLRLRTAAKLAAALGMELAPVRTGGKS